jgi:hypothetical protein
LLLVLHAPPKTEERGRTGRFFWRSPDGTWTSNELGNGIAALNKHLDGYEDLLTALGRQEEAAKTADDYFAVLERLAPVHRAARNLHRVLQEARKMLPDYRDIIDARDRSYSIERLAELLYDGTKNSLDFLVAKRAEEEAQASQRMATASHRLNILAAIFFPIVTLTGILGLDLATMAALFRLDVETMLSKGLVPLIFLGLLLVGLITGLILAGIVTRSPPQTAKNSHQQSLPKLH